MQKLFCLLLNSVNKLKHFTAHVTAHVTAARKDFEQVFQHVTHVTALYLKKNNINFKNNSNLSNILKTSYSYYILAVTCAVTCWHGPRYVNLIEGPKK